MKKTLTGILALILLISMSVTAFAAEYTPKPYYPGYTPYAGDDFSEEAVYERMKALEEVYPTGSPWGIKNFGGCGAFVLMLQQAAFGYMYDGTTVLAYRVHNNVDELKVGDWIHIPSSVSKDGHDVCVIGIKDGIVTIAEGNYNASVKWGRQFTIKQLSPGGAYAIREIASFYNEDCEVVRYNPNEATSDLLTGRIMFKVKDSTGKIIGYTDPKTGQPVYYNSETHGFQTTPVASAIATTPATTAPTTTTTTTPAATATPAPAQTTVTETKPAATAVANGITIENTSAQNNMSIRVRANGKIIGGSFGGLWSGKPSTKTTTISNVERTVVKTDTTITTTITTYGIVITATKGNTDVTVTYNGQTYTVKADETVTIK